ncbi:hypothetical protein [Phormidium sp. FACHB-1136]|uniref:hypothetical protein n=1 Tax=Phormidium sp. FACHB-1136 TaxID=2692848 RepID=UPI0016892ECE|nr:hypothetical protein [Phormidium sp. FACHB-1136]MBD2427966.1 hypothetical protein [Phormidium sp. FACHB-1136]
MLSPDPTLGDVFDLALAVAEAQAELSEDDIPRLRELLQRGLDAFEIDTELAHDYAQRIDALEG